jgi:hypothetical protein
MNKRGDSEILPRNIVSLVMAVIGILLILTVITILLLTYFGDISIEKASKTVDTVVEHIKQVQPGQTQTIVITNPTGWWLVYFNENINQNKEGFDRPGSFWNKKTICICKTHACNVKACREIDKPITIAGSPLVMKIEIMNLNVTNQGTFYDVAKV